MQVKGMIINYWGTWNYLGECNGLVWEDEFTKYFLNRTVVSRPWYCIITYLSVFLVILNTVIINVFIQNDTFAIKYSIMLIIIGNV